MSSPAPESYHDLREEILEIIEHPLADSGGESADGEIPSCLACGTILPEDTTPGWSGECPSCHRINGPEEVFY